MKADDVSTTAHAFTENAFSPVRSCMEQGLSESVFPGAVLLVAVGNKVLFHEPFGRTNVGANEDSVRIDTIFDLASLTKPLAAALSIAFLVHDGLLNWETSLADIFTDLKNKPAAAAGTTVLHLLSHCSGLPAFRPYYYWLNKRPQKHPKAWVRRKVMDEPLRAKPGRVTLYSDLDFILLDWVIERIGGMGLDKLAGERIYRPLGLDRTGFWTGRSELFSARDFASTGTCPIRKRDLRGEVNDRNAFVMHGVSGHAGLFSTAAGIHRILSELHGSWTGERGSLFPAAEVKHMLQKRDVPKGTTWALGFDTPSPRNSSAGRHFSRQSVGHLGFTGASFWLDLENGLIVILLTNRTAARPRTTAIKRFRPKIHDLAWKAAFLEADVHE